MSADALAGLLEAVGTGLPFLVIGVVVSTAIAVLPGLGSLFALALLLPFALQLEPTAGIALLVAAAAVGGTGNTVTSVLFGVPGSPGGAATVLDGYPMARGGQGARAVAAGIGASVVGAVVGAAFLALAIPVMRPLALLLGPAEFLALIVGSILLIARVGPGSAWKALGVGGLGLMLAFVGLEPSTATPRYTFGQLALWDGIPLVPMMVGLFAISECVDLLREGGSIARRNPLGGITHQIRQGLADVVRHRKVVLTSASAGLWVGVAPGLGETAAQFVAYGQARRFSRNPERFGHGAVEGVIAADAATNSKDGGALIPTLAFGVPGSASMAVLLGAFMAFGIQPGAEVLTEQTELVWLIIWVLILGNLLAGALVLVFLRPFAALTRLPAPLIAPPILVLALFGAHSARGQVLDIGVALAFAALGYVMKRFGYSRATFLTGFVLGVPLERNLLLSVRLYGWGFLGRPLTVAIVAVVVVLVSLQVLRDRRLRGSGRQSID